MVLNILVILIYKYIWNTKISTEGRPYSANMWLFCSHIKEFDFKAHFWYSSAFRLIIFNWICFHRKDMAYWFWDTTPSKSDTKTQCDAILRGAAHQRRKAQQISGMGTAATFLFGLRSCFLVSEITVEGRWKEVKKKTASPTLLWDVISIEIRWQRQKRKVACGAGVRKWFSRPQGSVQTIEALWMLNSTRLPHSLNSSFPLQPPSPPPHQLIYTLPF